MSKIPYPLEKIRAAVFDIDGVLSPTTVPLGTDGIPTRMANLRDGYSMVCALRAGLKIAIISGADTPAVTARFMNIGIKPEDFFTGHLNKIEILKEWMMSNGLTPEEVAYVGDDVPDIEPMKYVGLSVTPADGSIDTLQVARYITTARGGYGVARELLEEILRTQNLWPSTDHS